MGAAQEHAQSNKPNTGLAGPLRAPWAISPEGLKLVIAIASRDEFFSDVRNKALAAREGQALDNTHSINVAGDVAVIPVMGPLFRHASLLTDVSGATSYSNLRQDLQSALEDPNVKSILLNIDSPGGEANGCAELADAIFAARAIKPITAYVGGTGASAAYWLASAANQIICSPTAELGSIGVRLAVIDDSKAEEAAGVRTINFVSSQSPNKVLDYDDEEDCGLLQARVDAIADVFVGAVARNRGVLKDTVLERYGRGDVLVGKHAVAAGLADQIGSFESALSNLQGVAPMKTILTALSLPATATESDALSAVMRLTDERRQLLALSGKDSVAEAVGVVTAWKQSAGEVEQIKANAAKQLATQRDRDFDTAITDATKSGLLPLAADNKRRKHALAFKGQPNGLESLTAYLETLDPVVHTATVSNEPTPQGVGTVVLTSEEKHIAARMGVDPKKLAETKARRMNMATNPNDDGGAA